MENIKDGVPYTSVLGPLLLFMYINDLHNAIMFLQQLHVADDTCVLNL